MMKRQNQVSITDVARQAHVSVQTVSRVINDKDGVSPATRERIRQIIRTLDYRPNDLARSLVAGRSMTLACISQNITDFTLASIIEAMKKEAQSRGYIMLTGEAENEEEVKSLLDLFLRRQVDGLAVIDPGMDGRQQHVTELVNHGYPIVYISTTPKNEVVSYVNNDDYDCGYQATTYLIGLGHRQIATFTGPIHEEISTQRLNGYRQALLDHGLAYDERLVALGSWIFTTGYEGAQRLLAQKQPFTAVFAQSDPIAIGAMAALRHAGMRIPEDISIIGADDHPWVAYLDPPLTTMRQNNFEIGKQTVRLLVERIENPLWKLEGILVKTTLVERSSCTYIF